MSAVIEFQNVVRSFGRLDVLRGLTFKVRPGEIYAFLGRNGSGKTTALRILLGFLRPKHGQSFVLGRESRELGPDERGRIGAVGEGHRLYPTLRIRDLVRFEAGTRPRFSRAFAEKALSRCGLSPRRFIGLLSRGQRAQLALILAVSGDPEVLIFDDPAMGLDAVMRRELLDAMIDLLSDRGCGVLFSSHILSDVERIADRVGVLHDGRLTVNATLEDIKRRVRKLRWQGPDGREPPPVDGVLRTRARRDGFDLTLLDLDGEKETALRQGGGTLSEAVCPDLEELFLDLTGREGPSILPTAEEVRS